MSETKHYTGGCHCGRVRFEVEAKLEQLVVCNCSMCSKKAARMAFVGAAQFKLTAGGDQLNDYQFNKMNVHHLFCRTCGISSFSHGTGRDGSAMYSINVNCLDGVDVGALPLKHFDGRSL